MRNIGASLLNIDDPGHNGFSLGKRFLAMGLGTIEGPQELTEIQATLAMSENEDVAHAICNIVVVLMSSENGELLQTIWNSFSFKLIKVKRWEFTSAFDETGECMIPLLCIGHATMGQTLAAHYGQFRGGKNIFR
jgi:hypothetical protein